ncbi:MAG: hypothetical protein A2817_02185 [Candidatus Yanofskybacteria bacterium RIFCSPHIGHO2_01_FULL_39_8b]|uniref:Cell envelope-related transcriptional attenuator domain-containing protein n=1 Tax=Candidatus Yanofskybacteria bacterium RIFCSPHIGHO2_01_FULL_39_8b TaxID=1802659 RepID=A0A1F8EGZ6_9BACT|nr:MAG: hypothetical protein A2817_02185 [Candidatus Yanofskybacteria bacterium RIFCSPHIGHO2_01_FULL_39_8b]
MIQQPDFKQQPKPDKKRYLGVLFFVLLAVSIIYGGSKYGLGGHKIDVANEDGGETIWNKVANIFTSNLQKKVKIENDPDYAMPKPEDSRWDLLVLGVRGEDDKNAKDGGALLTDTMIVISYDKTSAKASMVSIPRDLYVRIYDDKIDKINSAYEIGILRKNGLSFIKKLISRITGIYIDSVVILNFSSFKKIIDDLGGINVYLDQPFSEAQQWGYVFSLPAGENHLNGQGALYYVRSRFSSSDFDRAQRQQKVIIAIKDKVMQLNLFSDPIKTLSILNTIRSNIETDLNIWDTGSLVNLSRQFGEANQKIKKYVLSTENFLYESHVQTDAGNLYVLLPKENNLLQIKQLFQDIFKIN